MKITELEKIIKQIEKYKLWDEIKDVGKWFKELTNKEIDNFIKLDVKLTKSIIKHKRLLINLLESDYYLQDIDLISNAKTDYIADCLCNVACNFDSLNSKHHAKDMERVSKAKTDKFAKFLSDVACDPDSLNSDHHEKDMDLISNAKSYWILYYLSIVACNYNSLESDEHENDMEQIATAKDDAEAKERYKTIIDKYKNLDKNQLTNEEKIDMIYQNAVKYVDKDESKELPNEVFKIKKAKVR